MARDNRVHGIRRVTVEHEDGRPSEYFTFNLPYIRSVKGFIQGTWSYDEFNKGLSGKNGFSDVDGHVERFGRSLVLEFKQSTQTMSKGQVLKAIRQAKYQKTSTWFIFGETNNPTHMIQVNENTVEGEYEVTDLEEVSMVDITNSIANWERWAKLNRCNPTNNNDWVECNQVMYKIWSAK